jgi:hypothetical protein
VAGAHTKVRPLDRSISPLVARTDGAAGSTSDLRDGTSLHSPVRWRCSIEPVRRSIRWGFLDHRPEHPAFQTSQYELREVVAGPRVRLSARERRRRQLTRHFTYHRLLG